MAKMKQNEKATDEFIENLIYHSMKTVELELVYKKDKLQAMKDNIQIRYRGFGWDEWKTIRRN